MRWPMAVIWSPGLRVSLSQPVPAMRLGLGPPEIVLTAEEPTPEWTQKLGQAPPIYSAEINYWLMRAALDILKNRPDIRVLYVHTTDYPMHMWAPEVPELSTRGAGLKECDDAPQRVGDQYR